MGMPMSSKNTPWIAPSILSADFARLGDEVNAVLAAGADVIHFDVMDNHYVPNLTIGPLVCEALRKHGITAPLDVHLMVKPVDRIVPDFAKAGATYISFHPEASDHVDRTIELIRGRLQAWAGAQSRHTALVPRSHAEEGQPGLLMSVNPGFGDRNSFRTSRQGAQRAQAHRRLGQADPARDRWWREGDNIAEIAAGCRHVVAGSAIFGAKDYKATISAMREQIAACKVGRSRRFVSRLLGIGRADRARQPVLVRYCETFHP